MGLVKFGHQTLNIENVPDGHILVSEQELKSLKDASNAFFMLNSKIPVGVEQDKIGEYVQRGQRYDTIAKERDELFAKSQDIEKKLQQYQNLPKDFDAERWNNYVNAEQKAIRQEKLNKLMTDALAKAEKDTGVKYSVDPRFIKSEILEKLDVDAKDALDVMYKTLDEAHTAQQEFIQKSISQNIPSPVIGAPENQPPRDGGPPKRGPSDTITADGQMKIQGY